MDQKATDEILRELAEAVVQFDDDRVVQLSTIAIEQGVDPLKAIQGGLCRGMDKVGDLFQQGVYFVPEVLVCADALNAGLAVFKPYLDKYRESMKKGKVLIGTIEGDVHEIGKSLVAMMLDIGGLEVKDLGVDVHLERFLSEHKKERHDIIAISALMSTTMLKMPEFIREIKNADPLVLTMVGGAPLSQELAKQFGADGYAEDARGAVVEAKRILGII
jgi:corrinoid protein of di/trimethylamine methyltransferase